MTVEPFWAKTLTQRSIQAISPPLRFFVPVFAACEQGGVIGQ
jgi:hypothetical protein